MAYEKQNFIEKQVLKAEHLNHIESGIESAVSVTAQSLTDAQKTQARSNIGAAPSSHTHDDRYYTESEIDTKLAGKSDTGHTHDDRYYTETEINTKLAGKSDTGHTHSNYVDLSSAQTVTAAKTFNGEQKFYNQTYCPTISDTASGVGCAFKASRGLFNEALIDKIIATASTGKIPFYKYTGTSGGSMTGLAEIASIQDGSMLILGKAVYGEHNKPTGTYSGNGSTTSRTVSCGSATNGKMLYIGSSAGVALVTQTGAICLSSGSVTGLKYANANYGNGTLTIATDNVCLNKSGTTYSYFTI